MLVVLVLVLISWPKLVKVMGAYSFARPLVLFVSPSSCPISIYDMLRHARACQFSFAELSVT